MFRRVTLQFDYLSEWPEVRYGILAQCQWKHCATVSTGNKTSLCYISLWERTHTQVHVCNQACRQSPDREQTVVNSFGDEKEELKTYGFVWGGICFFPKDSDWCFWLMLQAAIGLVFQFCKRVSVKGCVDLIGGENCLLFAGSSPYDESWHVTNVTEIRGTWRCSFIGYIFTVELINIQHIRPMVSPDFTEQFPAVCVKSFL